VVDGTVYIGTHDNHVYAVGTSSGDELWSFQTDGNVGSSPAVVDHTVYIGSPDGVTESRVYALDTASGTERWSFQTAGGVEPSPVVKDGTVYVAGGDKVYALGNSNTGSGETEIFNKCSACHTELNDYDDPAFCPECGADLSDSGSETQIYDPD
jgi:outer membrane protein assembly factor BamB